MHAARFAAAPGDLGPQTPIEVEVVIEVPRGSFLKRGSTGTIDFVSPLPCPFNYGAVPTLLGLEGDLLDAVVLGPRLPYGTRLRVKAWGAVTLTDRGMSDDKLICCEHEPNATEIRTVLALFSLLRQVQGAAEPLAAPAWGRNGCDGWCEASFALACARPLTDGVNGPPVPF